MTDRHIEDVGTDVILTRPTSEGSMTVNDSGDESPQEPLDKKMQEALAELQPLQNRLQAEHDKLQGLYKEVQAAYCKAKTDLCAFNDRYGRVLKTMREDTANGPGT